MLQSYVLPKKLKTVHQPGQQVEIWINERYISSIKELPNKEQNFLRDFVKNLEECGWKVKIQL